jgi:hypothetical protein
MEKQEETPLTVLCCGNIYTAVSQTLSVILSSFSLSGNSDRDNFVCSAQTSYVFQGMHLKDSGVTVEFQREHL